MAYLPTPPSRPEIVGHLLGAVLAVLACGGLAWLLGFLAIHWLAAVP